MTFATEICQRRRKLMIKWRRGFRDPCLNVGIGMLDREGKGEVYVLNKNSDVTKVLMND